MAAAVAVALEHGVAVDAPVVLADRSNVLLRLDPAQLVARVATTTAAFRPGPAWLAREVAAGSHLAARGAPAVRPSAIIDPGPHERDGLAISFWEWLPAASPSPDPDEAGRALRACHEAMADLPATLPKLGTLEEADRIVAALRSSGELDRAEAALLATASGAARDQLLRLSPRLRPLHGDAHLRNVIAAADGPRWADWEDTFLGPVEWDLACLVAGGRVGDRDPRPGEQALAAWGADFSGDLFEAMLTARAVQAVAWGLVLARDHPEVRPRIARWLAWLHGRLNAPTRGS